MCFRCLISFEICLPKKKYCRITGIIFLSLHVDTLFDSGVAPSLSELQQCRRILWRPTSEPSDGGDSGAAVHLSNTSDFYGSEEATTSEEDSLEMPPTGKNRSLPLRRPEGWTGFRLGNYRARRHWMLQKVVIVTSRADIKDGIPLFK